MGTNLDIEANDQIRPIATMMMMNVRIFTALYRLQVGDVGVVAYFSPPKYEIVHKTREVPLRATDAGSVGRKLQNHARPRWRH
jgi:hypothetical protein